jgi:hypothetical protein
MSWPLAAAVKQAVKLSRPDFSRETLRMLGFVERGLALSTGYDILMGIGDDAQLWASTFGTTDNASKPCCAYSMDVCLLDGWRSMVLARFADQLFYCHGATRRTTNCCGSDRRVLPERERHKGLPVVDTMTIPCISMSGT